MWHFRRLTFYGPNVTNADVESFYGSKESPDPGKALIVWIERAAGKGGWCTQGARV